MIYVTHLYDVIRSTKFNLTYCEVERGELMDDNNMAAIIGLGLIVYRRMIVKTYQIGCNLTNTA